MKKFKKKIAVLLGMTMLVSSLFSVSCKTEGDLTSSSSPSTENEQPCDVDTIIEKLTSYQFRSISLKGEYVEDNEKYDSNTYELSAAINLPEGDGDIYWYEEEKYEDNEDREPYSFYQNIYMRGWTPFAKRQPLDEMQEIVYPDGAEPIDNPALFTYGDFVGNIFEAPLLQPLLGKDLSKYEKYANYLFEVMGYEVAKKEIEERANTAFAFANAQLISLAEVTDAVHEEAGQLTLDLSKTAKVVVQDFKDLVNGIDEQTTLAELLKNPIVDKYMESIFRTAKAERVVSKFLEMYNYFEQDFGEYISLATMAKILKVISIQPDKDSTAYDYLVKLVTSESFEDLLESMSGNDFSINKTPITEVISLNSIQEWAESIWTEEDALCLNIHNEDVISLENMLWVYTVEDNYLTGASYSAKATGDIDEEEAIFVNIKGDLTYASEPMNLINADELLIYKGEELIFEDGEKQGDPPLPDCYLVATFSNNKLVDISVRHWVTNEELKSNYDQENNTFTFTDNNGVEETATTELIYMDYSSCVALNLHFTYASICIRFDSDGIRDVLVPLKEYTE